MPHQCQVPRTRVKLPLATAKGNLLATSTSESGLRANWEPKPRGTRSSLWEADIPHQAERPFYCPTTQSTRSRCQALIVTLSATHPRQPTTASWMERRLRHSLRRHSLGERRQDLQAVTRTASSMNQGQRPTVFGTMRRYLAGTMEHPRF